ncbi:hypothetical protein CLOSTASPAR_01931 [[Clostridium] asparagiforme DSM 15981]|uniref:Uncharacterized protein n=1 Tax=[Clostridium] asparagiforme DSM 15981 TaxID=518636 RepID=C0CY55_9FIRM|nr:hypothetical protein CLOSTASPAR_01931 [[Clostridium] asparagiforme DSM 15981]
MVYFDHKLSRLLHLFCEFFTKHISLQQNDAAGAGQVGEINGAGPAANFKKWEVF